MKESSTAMVAAMEDVGEAPEISPQAPPALERLGPSPFPKSGFPFLGFLATVYDHVASHVGGGGDPEE